MRPLPPALLALAVLNGVFVFYLACVVYRLATHAAMYASQISMFVLYYLGIKAEIFGVLGVIARFFEMLRDNTVLMLIAAAALALVVASRLCKLEMSRRGRAVVSGILAACFAATLAADRVYGITPLNDLPMFAAVNPLTPAKAQARLTVKDVQYLNDARSGVIAEVEGTLQYSTAMHRFRLHSPDPQGGYIAAYFHSGIRTSFSERLDGSRNPRYYDLVAPFVGKQVRVVGKCLNGAIYADVSDIALVEASSLRAPPEGLIGK